MRDKEMIEEMAKEIDDRLIEARGYLGSMNRGEGYWIAQKLVEHYQPKIPEGSVVLPKKLYEQYTNELNNYEVGKRDGSKETAREILEWLKAHCDYIGFSVIEAYFKDVFGVDIKK